MTTAVAAPPNGQATHRPRNEHGVRPAGRRSDHPELPLVRPPGSGSRPGSSTRRVRFFGRTPKGERPALRREHFRSGGRGRRIRRSTATPQLRRLFLSCSPEGSQAIQTVVMDTIGEVYRILFEEISNGKQPTLQNYGDVNTKLERFIRALRDLSVNVVLLAHEEIADIDGIQPGVQSPAERASRAGHGPGRRRGVHAGVRTGERRLTGEIRRSAG